jgi:hypothetical protein
VLEKSIVFDGELMVEDRSLVSIKKAEDCVLNLEGLHIL